MAAMLAALSGPAWAQSFDAARDAEDRAREAQDRASAEADRARAAADRAREREARAYERAQQALERASWADAVARFQAVIADAGARVDAAMYWKAYAQDRLGQRAEALTTVADLMRAYPKSRWLADARALEVQVRQRVGQTMPIDASGDDDLKLLALNALQHSDPAQALPVLRQILTGPQPIALKSRALFVLAQSPSDEARTLLAEVARQGNPDLQRKAIDYLGVHGSAANRQVLEQVYRSSDDVEVKTRVMRAFMVESDAGLRGEAVRQLGVMGAHDELTQLYQKESSIDVKRQILQAMFVGGKGTRLLELARTEPNLDLRRTAVRNLGLMGASKSGQALVDIYATDKDAGIRRAAVNGLFVQNNAEALVGLARKEKDPAMKQELVQKLSVMKSKVATDYLLELLGK